MLKMISVSIIFLSISYMGYYYGETFKKRYKQLNSVLKSVMFLNNEIIYSNTPLPEALEYVSEKIEEPLKTTLKNTSIDLNEGKVSSVYEAFKKNYINSKEKFYLNKDDKNLIKDFLNGLGESSVYGQDKLFNLTIENMKMNCISVEESSKKNSKMYKALGLCIGAMIAIFLF